MCTEDKYGTYVLVLRGMACFDMIVKWRILAILKYHN
jgi:hypothetical protein